MSNARTYTLADMDELLAGLQTDDYRWERGLLPGKARKLYGAPEVLSAYARQGRLA